MDHKGRLLIAIPTPLVLWVLENLRVHQMGSSLNWGPFLGLLILRVPYYVEDPKRDPNLENYQILRTLSSWRAASGGYGLVVEKAYWG